MDLLSQIMNDMDKERPNSTNVVDSKLKKEREAREKIIEKERNFMDSFRKKIQNKIKLFIENSNEEETYIQFPPMEQIPRSIIHDIAEDAGLVSMAFGDPDARYIVIYKNSPSEDEVNARKSGAYSTWNKEIAIEYKLNKKLEEDSAEVDFQDEKDTVQKPTRKSKISHNIECEAIGVGDGRNYGMVSSENKKDTRSIEQTLNDIRQKKKQKVQHNLESTI